MLTCIANGCAAAAKWKVVFAARPAPHWGATGAQLVALELCFCDKHRLEATLDALFTPAARQAMDVQFIRRAKPAPDWGRSELRFTGLAPEELKRALFTYAVYQDPSDFPGKFVVRKHASAGDTVFPQELVTVADSLEEARAFIPHNHIRMPRQPEDDAKLLEVWL